MKHKLANTRSVFSTFTTKFDNKEYVTLGVLNKFITLHEGIKDIHENKVKEVPNTVPVYQPAHQSVEEGGRKQARIISRQAVCLDIKHTLMSVMVLVLLTLKAFQLISPLLTEMD